MEADKSQVTRLLKITRGQIDGILKMIEEDRYCVDASNQVMAAQAILKYADKEIIGAHMKHHVHDAMDSEDAGKEIGGVIGIINQLMK